MKDINNFIIKTGRCDICPFFSSDSSWGDDYCKHPMMKEVLKVECVKSEIIETGHYFELKASNCPAGTLTISFE
jgi:hypothetical protein